MNSLIARQTQLFLKVNSLSSGTMAESCWESSSEEELCLTQSTFAVKSDEYDADLMVSTYCQSLQFLWFCVVVCNPML